MGSATHPFLNHSSSTSNVHHSFPDSGPSTLNESSNPSAAPSSCDPSSTTPAIEGNLIWLDCGQNEKRYLLVEDVDTGDVLIPLFYLKDVFKANYSRKIANLNNRLVEKPAGVDLGVRESAQHLYWLWSFESPQNIKTVIRKALGDACTVSGHLRLVLLPVVYNAMQTKADLRDTPLFAALEKAMRQSTYYPLLQPRAAAGSGGGNELPQPPALVRSNPDNAPGYEVDSMDQEGALFSGPKQYAVTAAKYMKPYKETTCKRPKREEHQQPRARAAKEVEESGSQIPVMTLSSIQEELTQQKRHCVQQAAKILDLERELAQTKAMVIQIYQMLEEGRQRTAHKPPMELDPMSKTFAAANFGEPTQHLGSHLRFEPSAGGETPHMSHMQTPDAIKGWAKRAEGYKREPSPALAMRRQHSTGCLPHASRGLTLISPGMLEQPQAAAITSHILALQPTTPAVQMVPFSNTFNSIGGFQMMDPVFNSAAAGHHSHFSHVSDMLTDPSGGPASSHTFPASS